MSEGLKGPVHVVEVTDAGRWNAALLQLPQPHVLQSWEWGAFKARHGWSASHLLLEAHGGPVAAALVLRRRAAPLPWTVLYVPKGPLWPHDDVDLLERVLSILEDLARRERALFVKIDPNVPLTYFPVKDVLHRRGWLPSAEQIQFRNTLLSDLTRPEEVLLQAMHSKTRYNIRLAQRRGVTVRPGGLEDLPQFYAMYAETAARNGFVIRPYAYYADAWGSFLQAGLAHLLIAQYQDELLAGVLLFRFGPTAWYMYGASRAKHRNLMPNHLLQWEAMRWAKAQGCTTYDWWGAPDHLEEEDPMWGVYRFKVGFGGQLLQTIGAWDFPVRRVGYWLYRLIIPQYLNLLRRRHQTGTF